MRKSRVKSFLNCKYILCYFFLSSRSRLYIVFLFFYGTWIFYESWTIWYRKLFFLIKFHSILFRARIKNFQVKLRSQVLMVKIVFSGPNYLKWERKKKRKKKNMISSIDVFFKVFTSGCLLFICFITRKAPRQGRWPFATLSMLGFWAWFYPCILYSKDN